MDFITMTEIVLGLKILSITLNLVLLGTSIKLSHVYSTRMFRHIWRWIFVFFFVDICKHMLWILVTVQEWNQFPMQYITWYNRLTWALSPFWHLAVFLIIDQLLREEFKFSRLNYIFIAIAGLISATILCSSVLYPTQSFSELLSSVLSFMVYAYEVVCWGYVFFKTILVVWGENTTIGTISRHQAKTLFWYFLLPNVFLTLIAMTRYIANYLFDAGIHYGPMPTLLIASYSFLTSAVFVYCARELVNLRFLNVKPEMHGKPDPDFLENLIAANREFCQMTTPQQVQYHVKDFFQAAFGIDQKLVTCFLSPSVFMDMCGAVSNDIQRAIFMKEAEAQNIPDAEEFLASSRCRYELICDRRKRIFLRDEVEFDVKPLAYNGVMAYLLQLMKDMDAQVIVPLYAQRGSFLGAMVIKQEPQELTPQKSQQNADQKKSLLKDIQTQEIVSFANILMQKISALHARGVQARLAFEKSVLEKEQQLLEQNNIALEQERDMLETANDTLFETNSAIEMQNWHLERDKQLVTYEKQLVEHKNSVLEEKNQALAVTNQALAQEKLGIEQRALQEKLTIEQKALQEKREYEDAIYAKQCELRHEQEAVQTLMKRSTTRDIGLVFSRNKKLVLGNAFAKKILGMKETETVIPERYRGMLSRLIHDVKACETELAINTVDILGKPVTFYSTIPLVESGYAGSVPIVMFYPDTADSVAIPFDKLKDPALANYALYLQTTKSGQAINRCIPGNTGEMLNFKILLLKAAITKKPLLLEVPEDDCEDIARVIHLVSLRTEFRCMKLHPLKGDVVTATSELTRELFGMNKAFMQMNIETSTEHASEKPEQQEQFDCTGLFHKLSETGTICMQNIEHLDLKIQESLAMFMATGYFSPQFSSEKVASKVRLLFSTQENLAKLVEKQRFSAALYEQLKPYLLSMPSLSTLPKEELVEMAQRFTQEQIVTGFDDRASAAEVLSLQSQETRSFEANRPLSIQELKERTLTLLKRKVGCAPSEKHDAIDERKLLSKQSISKFEAAGSDALRDPAAMQKLWDVYHNQPQIANLLGVHKSAVCRSLKRFSIVLKATPQPKS